MATTSQATLPPAAERQQTFEQAVAHALHLWPALTLSVANNWGGEDSSDKRDWFAGVIVDLFPEYTDTPAAPGAKAVEEHDLQDVEEVLLQVMVDEFDVNVDDDSAYEVATQIVAARTQCAQGQYDEAKKLQERFNNRNGKKVDQLFKKVEDKDQDTDWESDDSGDDDDDADVEMSEAPAAPKPPREKPVPEVDEDGFTTVTKKR
ncbi:Pre-rRNA-processing protein TSR2-domain-containing protein [Emericellopsis atlantica]|uniref:Pre-rRNA-processing protein TSR2-domain-containing protein n=1 Tax=Emericellopsis atlantica TaxID=2614577 RepID=A0A9P7ZG38_9HYPO|nr:Pre-rRNA-processing protein TSR2-domain-containing protein [Emericellopsis atlantica]KAG9251469.1 Pre-rRNA-processing protein TSR2-domain-containing protein [Emericellopsis atlantica]